MSYDSFVVQSCEDTPTLTNYDQTDGQVGIMEISTCDQTNLNTPFPQTLNNILIGDSQCAHQVDMVPEDDIRRLLNGFSGIQINHGSLTNATNFIVTGQVDSNDPGFKIFNGSIANQPIIENDNTQARNVEIWNSTVWVQEPLIAAGGNFTLNRWELWQNSTGDWQSGTSPNKSVELTKQTEGFRTSKDGRFLIQRQTQDSVQIRNSTTLEVVVTAVPNLEQGIDADLGPCNNFLYVLSNNGQDQTDLERFFVGDRLEGPAGNGNPNPCPDAANTQATNTTIGQVEDDPLEGEPSGDGPQSGDPGLLGDNTLQATADSLGINLAGVRIFYAGLLISGLALGSAVFTRQTNIGTSAGQAAMAGAVGGSVISLGLGLLPVWFFVLLGILGLTIIVIRR